MRLYLRAKEHVFAYRYIYLPAAIILPGLIFGGLRYLSRKMDEWREGFSGMKFDKASYALPHPFINHKEGPIVMTRSEWIGAVIDNHHP